MDRRERFTDSMTEGVLAALQGHQATIWTALPGIVRKVDMTAMTVEVEPAIQCLVTNQDDSQEWVSIPVCADVPIAFPGGGGFTLTFPIAVGDEALIVFSSRCIDAWWQSGAQDSAQPQAELRMHDLSDGFAIIGPRSQPRVLSPVPSTDGAELRNDARSAFVRIDGSANVTVQTSGNVQVTAGGDLTADITGDASVVAGTASVIASTIALTGDVTINGNLHVTGTSLLDGAVTNSGKNIGGGHTHSGVATGGGHTGGVD